MTDSIRVFLTEWSEAERTGDSERLGALLADDFLGVGPLGFVLPKPAWVARYRQGLAYETFGLEETQIRVYGDTVLVTARQIGRGSMQGSPLPFETVRATLTVVRQGERWVLAGIHLSFIAGTPGAPPLPSVAGPPKPAPGKEETP